jgi:hypothetical protein
MKLSLIALFLLSSLVVVGQTASAPVIYGISPANAGPGASVVIYGSNLSGVAATTFSYNSVAGTISATVPSTAKSGDVVVTTTDGGASAGFGFTVPLTITLQPVHLVVSAGQAQAFDVSVGGGAAGSTYIYVWKRGTSTVGANNRILYLPAISSADVGDYSVTVSDGASTVTSVSVALRLATPNVWTWRNPTTTGNELWAVAYGAGRYVAVGRGGTILTSTDGSAWVPQAQFMPTLFTNVVFADSKFVAVGSNGNVLVSTDGLSWTSRNVGEVGVLYGAPEGQFTLPPIPLPGHGWLPRTSLPARFQPHWSELSRRPMGS